MNALRVTPVVLGALLIAAHWARRGAGLPLVVSLAIPLLLLVRRPWAPRVVQGALVLAALEWIRTAAVLVRDRMLMHEPWGRSVVILGAVTAFTIVAALLLEHPAVRAHYARTG